MMIVWAAVLLAFVTACRWPGDWATHPDSSAGLILGADDCRKLWQHTTWVEMQLEAEKHGQCDALHAAISPVQERYGTPVPAFDHCWNVLKTNGYSISDIEHPVR